MTDSMGVAFENRNFQKELDILTAKLEQEGVVPRLLLHSCCAPCSSHCIEYLSRFFEVTVFYYNPNISQTEEYQKRVREQIRFINEYNSKYPVSFIEGDYEPSVFFNRVKGLEHCKEGGERCFACYDMRLREAAKQAALHGFDYFTTTLTISPLKNSVKINQIGQSIGQEYGVNYLLSDFKKKEGYKRSIQLSKEYGLYRQNYCGCVFSRRDQ